MGRTQGKVVGGDTEDFGEAKMAAAEATIVVTRSEHQAFANARRQAIPYGPNGTGMATRAQIDAVAREIYRDYPEILQALGLG